MASLEGIYYRTKEGEGVPIVFVHSWLGSKDSWRKVEEEIDVDNPKIFYDQRCHGESACSEFDFDKLAEDLHTLIEELDADGPLIVGHSMGGMVALTYAVEYSNFSGLFLIGSTASTPEPENQSIRFFLERFGSMDRRAWAMEMAENYTGEEDSAEAKDSLRRSLIEAGDTEVIYSLGSMMSYDVIDEIEEIEKPAAVVAGEKDRSTRMENSEELAELLDAELQKIDASNLLLEEKPEKVAELLTEFVENKDMG